MNFIVFDTETTNSLDCPFMYDFGYAVINNKGEVLKTKSFVVSEVFEDEELMARAYFVDKLPMYRKDIESGKRILATLATVKRSLANDCKFYNVHYLSAHNARFDYRSTTTTQRYITSSKYRYFLPYGVQLVDTLKMARMVLKDNDDYGTFCYENDYLTTRGCRRYTAEIIYRFLSGDNCFSEAHTGLEDVLIEKDILMYCLQYMDIEDGILW